MPLKNAQHDQIMRIYQNRRKDALDALQERKQTAYKLIPELSDLDRELAHLSIRFLTVQNNEDPKDIAQRIQKQKTDLLVSHQLPADYLSPRFACEDCQDTGYIGEEHCHCFYQTTATYLYGQSRIQERFKEQNFQAFDLSWYSKNIIPGQDTSPYRQAVEALERAKAFVSNFTMDGRSLMITGPTGVGKTFLSNCVGGALLKAGHFVIYLSASELFSCMSKHTFNNEKREETAEYNNIFNCDLLIIDDLGTEMGNTFTVSSLFQCVEKRLLYKRPTVITTNLDMTGLQNIYTERLLSRFIESYTWIALSGEDIRMLKRMA